MTGKYKFNTLDVYTTYGLAIESGSDTFLQLPKRKEPFSNDWAEFNGKEYDLTGTPKFEDRVFAIKGHIIATTEVDFWSKWNALQTLFSTTGAIAVNVIELGMTVNCFYRNMSNVERLTRIKADSKIAVKVEIELQEVQS